MPSTRPTVDPVLDILEELGYDFDELDGDGYKRSIREAIFRTHPDTGGKTADPEKFQILNKEFKKIRRGGPKPSDVEAKEKKSTIKGAKLLPGRGNFNADDIKPVDIDPESKTDQSSALIPKRLDGIANSVESIATLLRRQLGLQKKQQRDARVKQDKINKEDREDDLEKKPDKKTGGLPKAITKPALGFFERIKNFFLNIVIGAGVVKLFDWLKDPANAEKVEKFSNFLINNAAWILGGLATLALLPTILTVVSVVKGILSGLALLGPLLPALPWILGGILVGAVAWWIGKKIKKAIVGGEDFSKARDDNLKQLEAQGITKSGRVLDPDTGKEIYVKRWEGSTGASGDDKYGSIEGRPWGPGDKGRNDSVKINLNDAESQDWYGKFYGPEKLEEKLAALNLYKKTKADIIKKKDEMHDKLRDTVHVGGSIEKERESMDNPEWAEIMSIKNLNERKKRIKVFRKETARLEKVEREKIEKNYGQEALNIQKNSSSATIDKNIKPDTTVPGPSNKNRGNQTVVMPGGGGQQQSGGGGGGSSSSGTPNFASVDVQNKQTIATQMQYNKVTVDV